MKNDSLFRQMLRAMQAQFRHKSIDSKTLEEWMINYTHFPLSTLFDQYLRTADIPLLGLRFIKENGNANGNHRYLIYGCPYISRMTPGLNLARIGRIFQVQIIWKISLAFPGIFTSIGNLINGHLYALYRHEPRWLYCRTGR
jgi:hypothetical protein